MFEMYIIEKKGYGTICFSCLTSSIYDYVHGSCKVVRNLNCREITCSHNIIKLPWR